jgi:hypothetical protein
MFVATVYGKLVGTASIVADSPGVLPTPTVFGDVFQRLAAEGRLVAGGTLLACIDAGRRAQENNFLVSVPVSGETNRTSCIRSSPGRGEAVG